MSCYDSAYRERSAAVSRRDAGFVWQLPGCFQAAPSEKPHGSWTHQTPGNKHQQDTLFTETEDDFKKSENTGHEQKSVMLELFLRKGDPCVDSTGVCEYLAGTVAA